MSGGVCPVEAAPFSCFKAIAGIILRNDILQSIVVLCDVVVVLFVGTIVDKPRGIGDEVFRTCIVDVGTRDF